MLSLSSVCNHKIEWSVLARPQNIVVWPVQSRKHDKRKHERAGYDVLGNSGLRTDLPTCPLLRHRSYVLRRNRVESSNELVSVRHKETVSRYGGYGVGFLVVPRGDDN